jgi:outer membrane lipoprotein-sorting protein
VPIGIVKGSAMKKSTLRWVPAISVPAVVIAGAVALPSMANATVSLPSKSAAEIVTLAQKSAGTSFSGTISETANLGLPEVPSSAFGGSSGSEVSSVVSQLTGTHKAKVYVKGNSAERVQTLDDLAERDFIRNGKDVWAYDSAAKTATHATLPSHSSHSEPSEQATPQTPADVTAQALAQIGKYTTVTTSDNILVAGQKAYQITLTPKDSTTLISGVTLAVDASTGVPLKAVIDAKGQKDPAFSVAFTSIDYSTPSASTFAFTPPAGTKVTTLKTPTGKAPVAGQSHTFHPDSLTQDGSSKKATHQAVKPTVIGSGWSTVVGVTLPAASKALESGGESGKSSALLDQILKPVSGGKVVQTALGSVFLTTDGKVYVGAVSATDLEAAVAAQK